MFQGQMLALLKHAQLCGRAHVSLRFLGFFFAVQYPCECAGISLQLCANVDTLSLFPSFTLEL